MYMQKRNRFMDTENKHSYRSAGGKEERQMRFMVLTNTNYYIHKRQAAVTYCRAQRIIPILF